jgi:hypothetical protein
MARRKLTAHTTRFVNAPHAGAAVAWCEHCTWLRLAPTADHAAGEGASHTAAAATATPAADLEPVAEAA